MKYYSVDYDLRLVDAPGLNPVGPIQLEGMSGTEAEKIVREFLRARVPDQIRPPTGHLRHPYVVPGAMYNDLWDWDAFLTAMALPDEGLEAGLGSIRNLLEAVREDGRPAKMGITSHGCWHYKAHPIPLLAQFAYLMGRRAGNFDWLAPHWPALPRAIRWYENETRTRDRYFVWLGFRGNGQDNNPAVYGRPPRSTAGIDLACWHYREYRAMAKLAGILNQPGADTYRQQADDLRSLIADRYWDVMDEMFYAVDCLADKTQSSRQGIAWELFLKFRSCASLYPLWAGIASPAQAAAMRRRILDPAEFLSVAGIRSYSARDPIYNNAPLENPSNWQGPVWAVSTYFTAYGLARYGWREDALEVAARLTRVFAADIAQNGCLHEFYHGDTGQPLHKPGFLSWNMLALRALDDLRAGQDGTTLDLLEETC